MADAKVNMSLDDIIKMNKKEGGQRKAGGAQRGAGARRGGGRAGARVGGIRGGARGVATQRGGRTFVAAGRKTFPARTQKAVVNKRVAGLRAPAVNNAQTKKLVNKLVKKALKTRLGASVAAGRLAVANRAVGGGILSRINARSRVITKRAPAIVRPVIQTVQRGRGFRGGAPRTLYQDEAVQPVVVQQVQRPRPRQQIVVQRVVEAPRTQRVIQRVVQQPKQRVIVQRQPARQRIQRPQQQQQRVIVVERPAPVQRVQRVQKVIQRVQPRTQFVRQRQQQPRQEVVQYVQARNRKNNNFRNALGLGGPRRFETVEVERFEPSTSFITRKVVRRGRGFQN